MSEAAVIVRHNSGETTLAAAGSVLIIDDEAAIRESLETLLELDGYVLPMPTPKDWFPKAFVYPPLMQERLADSIVLAQRLADYTVFDGMDEQTKISLVRIANK